MKSLQVILFLIHTKINLLKGVCNFSHTPNLSVVWNVGFILIFLILIQILIGIFLSFIINSGVCLQLVKFNLSKEDVWSCILIYMHSIIPHFIFFLIYLHILKGIFYIVNSVIFIWVTGIILFISYVIIVFTGYSLVFSSLGFWALTVSKEILIEIFGIKASSLLLFFESIGIIDKTLYKIFTIHYLISYISLGFTFIHVLYIHTIGNSGSKNFLHNNEVRFLQIGVFKDILAQILSTLLIWFVGFLTPQIFIVGEFNISLEKVFSVDISVEWYLRLFFVILRSIEIKRFGILFTGYFIFLIFIHPYLKTLWGLQDLSSECLILILFSILYLTINISYHFYSSTLYLISISLLIISNILTTPLFLSFNFFNIKLLK